MKLEFLVNTIYLACFILFVFLSFYFFVKEGLKQMVKEVIDSSTVLRSINDRLAEIKSILSETKGSTQ